MNTDGFDWSLVRSFLAAIEHGSLLAAARATGASQPTMGRHISELESQLGLLLFERTGRGLVPTPAAAKLAEAARLMDGGAAQLWRQAKAAEKGTHGAVRLTASQPVACILLPPILAGMRETLPDIEVSLVANNRLDNLLRREADIALRMLRPDQASLSTRRIGQVSISACAHKAYLKRRGTPAAPADLLEHDLVGDDRGGETERGAAALGLPARQLRFGLRSDDLIAQWAGVRAGLGIGFIADYVLRTDPAVTKVLPLLKLPRYPVWLTVHREIRTSARIRAVYDHLALHVAAALAPDAPG